jgi:hypothetical protein
MTKENSLADSLEMALINLRKFNKKNTDVMNATFMAAAMVNILQAMYMIGPERFPVMKKILKSKSGKRK